MQHTLSSLFERYSDSRGSDSLEDPGVDALLSGLLHDELEDRRSTAQAEAAAEAAQWDEERRAMEAQEAERARERAALQAQREAERAAQEAARREEAEKQRAENEAHLQQMRVESTARREAHEAFMEVQRQKREANQLRHAAAQEQHTRQWDRISGILREVHTGLEAATGGWRDVPFWDSFFQNTSSAASWDELSLQHLEPALRASALQPSHSVLVLEPGRAGLAGRLAAALQQQEHVGPVLASAYGAEQSGSHHDLVIEVGLLDAMAMSGEGGDMTRLQALQSAAARLATLVKPGGTWISVSAVPPTLRTPLLGRLAGDSFFAPAGEGQEAAVEGQEAAVAGTHAITLVSPSADGDVSDEHRALRGAGAVQVANMLLYGGNDARVWAYRLHRAQQVPSTSGSGNAAEDMVLDMIRQQRPGTRDDL